MRMIEVKASPVTRDEIAAKAAHDLLRGEKWLWRANKIREIPEILVEDTEQLLGLTKKGHKIFLKARGDVLDVVAEWLEELAAWGFTPEWLEGREIPTK